MRKYEVDRVHNSKDDEIYQIAQSVEQKIRTGMLMPDYEIGQKAFHNWGDIILNYVDTSEFLYGQREGKLDLRCGAKNDWFESTCTVNELENDGKYYVTELVVDHQNLKVFKNASEQQITSSRFLVSFIYRGDGVNKPHIEYYNEDNEEWQDNVYNGKSQIEYNYRVDKSGSNDVIVRIRCYNKRIRIRTDNGYLTKEDNSVKGYACFSSNGGEELKGIFVSKNKKWIYISDNSLHDVCVKHGGMKYIGEHDKTIYKLTNKNTLKFGEQKLMYYGYSKPRNGRGIAYKHSVRLPRKYRIGWIKCEWLNNDFTFIPVDEGGKTFDEICKLLSRRKKSYSTQSGGSIHGYKQIHFIRVNTEDNCFELWNFIINPTYREPHYTGPLPFIKPIFLRTLSKEETWNILNKKFTGKIYYKE